MMPEESKENWQSEHSFFTENPAAAKATAKYKTIDDYHKGAYEAMTKVGKPYWLPESLENLPDDKVREEFTSQISKLFDADGFLKGMTKSEDDLKDIDFAEGYADARHANNDFIGALKKFAVDKKLPKETVKDLVGFINQFNQGMINSKEKELLGEAEKVKETLTVMCGSEEVVSSSYDNVRKLFQNHCGITAQEYEKTGKDFVEKVLMKNAVMSKALFNLAKDIVVEGETEGGGEPGGQKKTLSMAERQNKELPTITKAVGWRK